jgi:hypothetical protein
MVRRDRAPSEARKVPLRPRHSSSDRYLEVPGMGQCMSASLKQRANEQYSLAKPPSSRKSEGATPSPLSSTEHPPRAKSTAASTLEAFASRAFFSSPSTTPVREPMAVDDLIWATTSSGSGRIALQRAGVPGAPLDAASSASHCMELIPRHAGSQKWPWGACSCEGRDGDADRAFLWMSCRQGRRSRQ